MACRLYARLEAVITRSADSFVRQWSDEARSRADKAVRAPSQDHNADSVRRATWQRGQFAGRSASGWVCRSDSEMNTLRESGRMGAMTGLFQATLGAEAGTVELAEPALQNRPRSSEGDLANDWLCVACLNRVASETDRYLHEGKSEFSFKNPEGIRFNILTFSRTLGCLEIGVPTLEHTWFAGHAWSFCVCDRCHMHLGWYYAGPSDFAALICDRIFRAALSGN